MKFDKQKIKDNFIVAFGICTLITVLGAMVVYGNKTDSNSDSDEDNPRQELTKHHKERYEDSTYVISTRIDTVYKSHKR